MYLTASQRFMINKTPGILPFFVMSRSKFLTELKPRGGGYCHIWAI